MRGTKLASFKWSHATVLAVALAAIVGAVVALHTPSGMVGVTPARAATLPPVVPPAPSVVALPEVSEALVSLGKEIFFDTNLSSPPGTSCASCHDPARGFAGNHGSTLGVALGSRSGHYAKRNTPSVLYLRFVRKFHLHWEEDAPLVDAFGGFFWDGRTDSLTELVAQPLFNPDEMNGGNADAVAKTIAAGAYADAFSRELRVGLDDAPAVLRALGEAVAAYLLSPAMAPFSSKYDDYIRGRTLLTEQEAHGLALFKDSAKGGCSACHRMNDRSPDPERSLFTDYGFDAVGVPRNRHLPATRDATYFDLGLCEHAGADYREKTDEFCGRFRAPSLRNVATRTSFMHNGAFSSLRDVVSFYATRGTTPQRWYGRGLEFDDLPARYRDNVNVDKAPYSRHPGETPPLDDGEIDAIVAFLGTLSDAPPR